MRNPAHRRHSAALLRIVFAVLALTLPVRPLLTSMGGLHQASHEGGIGHSGAGIFGANATAGVAAALEGDSGDRLHTLLHFAECWGQAWASPSLPVAASGVPESGAHPVNAVQAFPPRARLQAPFRPPIIG
jgi:hypothetical protein